MHALGNDFCVFGSPTEKKLPDKDLICKICDRHYGVGCDCAVFVGYSNESDYFMHVYNPDGFEAEICGNALRCSAKYVCDSGYFSKKHLNVQTRAGSRNVLVEKSAITTEIGIPHIEKASTINIAGINIPFVSVSLGNPHCVVFVNELTNDEFNFLGRRIENHPNFPEGTNVEFAFVSSNGSIEMRVWERGIGETLSCTTGSCACFAVAKHLGFEEDTCDVIQPGGTLKVISNEDGYLSVTGNCTTVFKGQLI